MKGFFKYVFASMLGFIFGYIVIALISVFIAIGVMSYVASKTSNKISGKEVTVKENTILRINLNKPIVERTDENPLYDLDIFPDEAVFPVSLKDIVDNIAKAKTDDRIKGIYLNLMVTPASFATLEEIREALIDFKTSGKFIYAYSSIMSEGSYYLASVADGIYMQPEGMFIFDGFNSESAYLKGMFDKLDIEPIVIRHGKYKSAGESFDHYEMTEENRLQLEEFIFPLYDAYIAKICESRKLNPENIKDVAANFKVRRVSDAVKFGLIDSALYADEMYELMKDRLDVEKLRMVSLEKYKHSYVEKKKKKEYTKDRIALIYAVGEIGMGKGSVNSIGAEGLSKAIRKARLNDDIKAIVLRVNSPGGSALASDIIWREVKLAKESKPVVVSMGDVAASGGYYISCIADTIVAQPNTITGSIGVIGIFANMEEFWKNKLGIQFSRISTGNYSDLANPNRTMTEDEKVILQSMIDDVYQQFTSKVAAGRNIPVEVVDSFGQGRIWSGKQALEIGLVDVLGGMDDAIEIAAGMAGLENYRLKILPKIKNPFEKIFSDFSLKIKTRVVENALGEDYNLYRKLQQVRQYNGPYMIVPYSLDIQ